jgi:hypothetical protein
MNNEYYEVDVVGAKAIDCFDSLLGNPCGRDMRDFWPVFSIHGDFLDFPVIRHRDSNRANVFDREARGIDNDHRVNAKETEKRTLNLGCRRRCENLPPFDPGLLR